MLEADDELALAAPPRQAEGAEALEQRQHPRVVAADGGYELRDPRGARVGGELVREDRPDPLALVRVRDRERDLGGRARTDEARDPDRLGIPVDVPDEDVVVGVDSGEACELELGQPRLCPAEAPLTRAVSEALEEGGDRSGVPVPQRPDREPVDEARVPITMVNAGAGPLLPRDGPSC